MKFKGWIVKAWVRDKMSKAKVVTAKPFETKAGAEAFKAPWLKDHTEQEASVEMLVEAEKAS